MASWQRSLAHRHRRSKASPRPAWHMHGIQAALAALALRAFRAWRCCDWRFGWGSSGKFSGNCFERPCYSKRKRALCQTYNVKCPISKSISPSLRKQENTAEKAHHRLACGNNVISLGAACILKYCDKGNNKHSLNSITPVSSQPRG